MLLLFCSLHQTASCPSGPLPTIAQHRATLESQSIIASAHIAYMSQPAASLAAE